MNYHWSNIRTLLREGFTTGELRTFCHENFDFRPVYRELAENTGLSDVIEKILDHAERKMLIETLLEWTREHNPKRYEIHRPYSLEESASPSIPSGPNLSAFYIVPQDHISFCKEWLTHKVPHSIAVNGEHGFGKTVIVRDLLKPIAKKEQWGLPTPHFFVYLDCETIEKPFNPKLFWHRILAELQEEAKDNRALQTEVDKLFGRTEINGYDIRRLLEQQLLFLVLLLDHFDEIINSETAKQTDLPTFLNHLRGFQHPRYATLIIATRKPLHILCKDVLNNRLSPFINIFTKKLHPPLFNADEVKPFLESIFNQVGIEFSQDDQDFLCRFAGLHPALLEKAGYHLAQQRQKEYGQAPLTERIAQEIIENFEIDAASYFTLFWENSFLFEQSLLILVILSDLARQSFPQLDRSFDRRIRILIQENKPNLDDLEARGLIRKNNGAYQIFSAAFAIWITHKIAKEKKNELDRRYRAIEEKELCWIWRRFRELVARSPTHDMLIRMLIGPLPSSTGPTPSTSEDEPPTPISGPSPGKLDLETSNPLEEANEIKMNRPLKPNPDDEKEKKINHLQKLITTYQNNKDLIELQIAKVGGEIHASTGLMNELNDTREELQKLYQELSELNK